MVGEMKGQRGEIQQIRKSITWRSESKWTWQYFISDVLHSLALPQLSNLKIYSVCIFSLI